MRYYVTFSACRTFGSTTIRHPLCTAWVEIEAPSDDEARQAARALFGEGFAGLYSSEPSLEDFPHGRVGDVVLIQGAGETIRYAALCGECGIQWTQAGLATLGLRNGSPCTRRGCTGVVCPILPKGSQPGGRRGPVRSKF